MKYFVKLLVIIGSILQLSLSDEVTIVDTRMATTEFRSTGWYITPRGWTEMSETDERDMDIRTFMVCRRSSPGQDNWLRTPYLQTYGAARVFINMRLSIMSCKNQDEPCTEGINLYYLPSNNENEEHSTYFTNSTYTKVDTLTAEFGFDSTFIRKVLHEAREISLGTKGLYIAFQDNGACASIIYIRVFIKVCPETVKNLAWYPLTNTGSGKDGRVKATGVCVENAVLNIFPVPTMFCLADGNWSTSAGGCQCAPGYQPNRALTECNECPFGKYKSSPGNTPCSRCPSNSYTLQYRSTQCKCRAGFFRAPRDRPATACTKPPSAPTSPTSVVSDSSVVITWCEPGDNGGRKDVTYRISCEVCDSLYYNCDVCDGNVKFIPGNDQLTAKKVEVHGFTPNTYYKFKIFAVNGVSSVSTKSPNYAELHVKTNKAAPPAVSFVRVVATNSKSVLLRWTQPPYSGLHIIDYEIRLKRGTNETAFKTKQTSYMLQNLNPDTLYTVQVRAQNKIGFGPYSRSTAFKTKLEQPEKKSIATSPNGSNNKNNSSQDDAITTHTADGNYYLILTVAISSGVLCFLVVIILLFIKRRRRLLKATSGDIQKYPVFENSSDALNFPYYVDPSTYEDPYLAVLRFAKEIPRKMIKIENTISSGDFGDVSKGVLNDGIHTRTIAVKSLKDGFSGPQKLDFLAEASIMGQFDHPNVIRLEGVVTRSRPLMIITEFMENGSLQAFIREKKSTLQLHTIVHMLYDVVLGMDYLSQMGYIHRNLAAKNILVDSNIHCKISNFGLSRCIEKTKEEEVAMYSSKGGVIPIRWSSPEALQDNFFTSASDVWSFGVVTWEVLSQGENPYWEMINQDVIQFIECGYRLPAPCFCPRLFHQMMLECWHDNHLKRPSFDHLVTILKHFLSDPSCLEDTLNQKTIRDQDDCIPESLDMSSLTQWLEEIHLMTYRSVLLRHGCVTAEQIMRLSAEELEYMGITDRNDINTILQESEILRFKIEQTNKIGVAV